MMIGGLSSSSAPYVLDYGGEGQRPDRGGVLAQRLDPALEAWVGRGQHTVALVLVALDPLLPAERGHPEAVDQHDGVGGGGLRCAVVGHGDLLTSPFSSPSPVCLMRGSAHPLASRTSENSVRAKFAERSEVEDAGCSVQWTLLAYWCRSAVRGQR
jgi:hypothetical protein